ncbi:zinc finger, C3HC4 type (RING finger) protein (macronuclear) [Tetrahymena thermophila SB210]|uniref:Zinc finger, C3HC4 type (RING finger) protein n=1 Tax=Tetrahymena thermophila (strain SB210) TaxID=312017 RepID=W7XIP3_TETTS|nr:zinc finger, C3HC4 type (RING finger) protein [Tetrahymena thermophila SB210]EWS73494.1 zinc finger, C3HC4 type (RING finger) protein [Tetrahymena thermophila SB210]|eukprot:XP_012653976.1 zinc finger, C3HC4 type (RING finger) protein [Tetrahymena thermophila SB210]
MEGLEELEDDLNKLKRESNQRSALAIAFLAIWIYLFTTQNFEAQIFVQGFLSGMNIAQICTSCLIQMIFLLTKRKIQCFTLFKCFSFCLGLLTLIDFILIIITVIFQSDPFNQKYQFSYSILGFMFLTVLTIWIQSDYEYKIIKLQIRMVLIQNEIIRNLLQDYLINQNNRQDEENIQQRVERIQSIDPSQIDPVYGNICTICNDECGLQEKAVQLKCLHIFHGECIRKWLLQQRYCPNCRDQVF